LATGTMLSGYFIGGKTMNTIKFHSWEGHKCILVEDVLALIDEITPVHIRMGSNTTAIRELKKRIEG